MFSRIVHPIKENSEYISGSMSWYICQSFFHFSKLIFCLIDCKTFKFDDSKFVVLYFYVYIFWVFRETSSGKPLPGNLFRENFSLMLTMQNIATLKCERFVWVVVRNLNWPDKIDTSLCSHFSPVCKLLA
jgi:hypothetical protein